MDIVKVLSEKYSGTQWNLVNNDYKKLTWDDTNSIEKPTLQELEQKWQEIQDEKPMKIIREKRDLLLKETDVYGLTDFKFKSEEAKQAWLDYRQALRDLPANTTDPENPVWPVAPN
jgi:hypothetical protein